MNYDRLSDISREVLHGINNADNPVEYLNNLFDTNSEKENDKLRAALSELVQKEYVIINWADNKPYIIRVTNSGRFYEENFSKNENFGKNNISIKIGDNNRFEKSEINIGNMSLNEEDNSRKSFYDKHPIICGILISLFVGVLLMFKFWTTIVQAIETIFNI